MKTTLIISGSGGQGILILSDIIIYSAFKEEKNITWLPSYGPESRGGTSNCQVIISDSEIGSPIVDEPDVLIVMNLPSLNRFEYDLKEDGILIYDSSVIDRKPERNDIVSIAIPALEITNEVGSIKAANMVLLGAYLASSGSVLKDTVFNKTFPEKFSGAKEKFIPLNRLAVERGMDYCRMILNEKKGGT